MTTELAKQLHESGKAHAWSACLLHKASVRHAEDEEIDDPQLFAFNGTPSLSIHYLLGLGIELMLKSAIVAWDPDVNAGYLQNTVGHDLIKALDEAEARGFTSQAEHLRELSDLLRAPYKKHFFRYDRPAQMNLPGDFVQVEATLGQLESELATKLQSSELQAKSDSCG